MSSMSAIMHAHLKAIKREQSKEKTNDTRKNDTRAKSKAN